jgi:hypothetical protein
MKTAIGLILILSALCYPSLSFAEGGSIHNHVTLDVIPIGVSPGNLLGWGGAISIDHYHDWLKTSYDLSAEFIAPYQSGSQRTDVILWLGAFTSITPAFSIGARVGALVNDPVGASALAAVGLRLPALAPEDKTFFSFFFEEIDIGVSGIGGHYASMRFGMKLL